MKKSQKVKSWGELTEGRGLFFDEDPFGDFPGDDVTVVLDFYNNISFVGLIMQESDYAAGV